MIRLIVAATLLATALAATGPAAAQAIRAGDPARDIIAGNPARDVTGALPLVDGGIPTLKRNITVTSEVVRIGDLINNAGAAANIPVFRSPDVGTTGAVPARKIIEAARANNLFNVAAGEVIDVVVTRSGRIVGRKEIEDRIARLFSGTNGLGAPQDLLIGFDHELANVTVDMPIGSDLKAARAQYDPRSGRFDVVFEIPVGTTRRSLVRFTGSLVETAEVVVLTRSIGRSEIVRGSDAIVERRNKADVPVDAVLTLGEVMGRAARQPLRQGLPLRRADLMKPEVIKRDETITLYYQVPGITLTTRGKALEPGGNGDVINVVNLQSKHTVQGVVTGPGRVDIGTPTSRAAEVEALEPSENPTVHSE